jgi:hypothetical protein
MQGPKAKDDKVESLNRLPHHKKFKLEVVNPTIEIEGKEVGSNAMFRYATSTGRACQTVSPYDVGQADVGDKFFMSTPAYYIVQTRYEQRHSMLCSANRMAAYQLTVSVIGTCVSQFPLRQAVLFSIRAYTHNIMRPTSAAASNQLGRMRLVCHSLSPLPGTLC